MRESTTATNEVGTRTGGRIGRVARWFALLLAVAGFAPAIGWAGAFFDIREGKVARVTNYYNLEHWLKQVQG